MCFICFICLHFGVGVQGVILRPLSGPFRGLRRPGRNLTPFNRTFLRIASKTTYSKVLVPIWFIWCQTCPGVPEPVRNRIFVRRSPPIFVHLVAHWPWLPFFGNQKPLKNYPFVRCSFHFGPFGAKLARIIFRYPSTMSHNPQNDLFA